MFRLTGDGGGWDVLAGTVLNQAASAPAAPLWQTVVSLLGTAIVVLGGVYAMSKSASDALNKRLDDLKSDTSKQQDGVKALLGSNQELLKQGIERELSHLTEATSVVAASVSGLSDRLFQVTGRMDRVIEQQGDAARVLAAQGTQMRDLLDARLADLNRTLSGLVERVGRLESGGGGSGPFR